MARKESAVNEESRRYGEFYWCVALADEPTTEVYLHADAVEVTASGSLLCKRWARVNDDERIEQVMVAFAAGEWRFFYAASVLDGAAVSVAHWPGQIL